MQNFRALCYIRQIIIVRGGWFSLIFSVQLDFIVAENTEITSLDYAFERSWTHSDPQCPRGDNFDPKIIIEFPKYAYMSINASISIEMFIISRLQNE